MKKPLIVELSESPSPAEAPPVMDDPPQGRAMQIAARLAARPRSRLGRFFWAAASVLLGFVVSVAAWRFVEGLLASSPLLGGIAAVLIGLFVLAAALVALRELAAFARLARLDHVHRAVLEADDLARARKAVEAARSAGSPARWDDLARARKAVERVAGLYSARDDMAWPRQRLAERAPEQLDPQTLLTLAETELMAPLDAAARLEIEAAARTVATVTALVPLALADVFAALTANLRMIRRVAEIYGGRAGTLGAMRLARTVLTHLVATGAVAAGDDLVETVTGGHIFAKLSRRFGEGVVNGALTARVGVAAMEVCRPMPFRALPKPRVTALTGRALAGVFDRAKDAPD
ncbi:YcjF family protein [Paenirhodobacter sp.]|uniref:YcjF family protein n=1 Tax=Paenirhodobacter sp. TaxID=1965326 RepID=UPI003B3FC350